MVPWDEEASVEVDLDETERLPAELGLADKDGDGDEMCRFWLVLTVPWNEVDVITPRVRLEGRSGVTHPRDARIAVEQIITVGYSRWRNRVNISGSPITTFFPLPFGLCL